MTKKQSSKNSSKSNSSSSTDAIALLRMDHEAVKKLFKQFEKSEDAGEKMEVAATICKELTVHATIEEEIFYPAAREALGQEESDLMDEAEVEHASAKDLIAQIEAGSPDDDLWESKVTVLGEYIDHHVKEEHDEMFPKVRKSEIDLKALGEQLEARKSKLTELADKNAASRATRANGSKGNRTNGSKGTGLHA